jgi:hypothetical protein
MRWTQSSRDEPQPSRSYFENSRFSLSATKTVETTICEAGLNFCDKSGGFLNAEFLFSILHSQPAFPAYTLQFHEELRYFSTLEFEVRIPDINPYFPLFPRSTALVASCHRTDHLCHSKVAHFTLSQRDFGVPQYSRIIFII